jgi:hypothetical protein
MRARKEAAISRAALSETVIGGKLVRAVGNEASRQSNIRR